MTGLGGSFDDLVSLPECMEIAERTKDGRRFLILLNYMPEPQEIILHRQMTDLVLGKTVSGRLDLDPFGVLVLEVLE